MRFPLKLAVPIGALYRAAFSLAAAAAFAIAATHASADPQTAMAPPVQPSGASSTTGTPASNSVFNWQEVPQNQNVVLTSASFDLNGYQLYDTVGETIVIPFTNQNLYVMKFARSADTTMYFVNTGADPVLYVPKHGYLDNATVPGARWYPFGKNFHPTSPVYLGIAPSWNDYIGMGWYPSMFYFGGYWGQSSFVAGGAFVPSLGLFIQIGGQHYAGWGGYTHYYQSHPGFVHVGYRHGHPPTGIHRASSTRHFTGTHNAGPGRTFQGARSNPGAAFGGRTGPAARGVSNNGASPRSFGGGGGGRTSGGGGHPGGGGGHSGGGGGGGHAGGGGHR